MEVLLVRHMESTFNVAHRVQGQTNKSVLTSEGVLRAKKLSFALKEKYPHAEGLFSSDLVRARQTANELALPYSLPVVFDPRLREVSRGFFEGISYDSLLWKFYKKFEKRGIDLGTILPGMESLDLALDRFIQATTDKINSDRLFIVVSHGEVMRLFWARLSGFSLSQTLCSSAFHIRNGCVLEIDSTFNPKEVLL